MRRLHHAWDRLRVVLAVSSPFDRAAGGRRPPPSAGPADLRRALRTVDFSLRSAGDVHSRLRPMLRGVAVSRLATHRGIDLQDQPAAARAALGEDLWEFLRDDHQPPDDSFGPGLTYDQLRALVATLEAL